MQTSPKSGDSLIEMQSKIFLEVLRKDLPSFVETFDFHLQSQMLKESRLTLYMELSSKEMSGEIHQSRRNIPVGLKCQVTNSSQ